MAALAHGNNDDSSDIGNSDSLRLMLKHRIIDDVIKDAQSKMDKKYSLLICDDHTISILHHVLKMHELNEMNIGVVLNVAYPRERVKVSPIYFLSPTQKSIQHMIDDYKDPKKPCYGAPIHAYFCSSLSPSLIEMIKASKMCKYLATLKEIPCDLLVVEKRVFSFGRDSAFDDLYISKNERIGELTKTAKQLVGLMLSINEEPYIRFSKDSRMAGQLAQSVSQNFSQLKRNLKNFSPRAARATLIIMDRSDDPITPLLHELTFQAMVMDMLHTKIDSGKIDMGGGGDSSNNTSARPGADEEKGGGNGGDNAANGRMRAMPDENDEIWVQYRHGFIGDVVKQLPDQFKQWQSVNAVVKLQGAKGGKGAPGGKVDSRTLMDAARDMPQYKTLIKKYTTNINLATSLISLYKSYGMRDLVTLEQDIVTGINEDGHKCDRTKIQQQFCNSVLLDPNKPQDLKLRMFMMYVISQGGMKPEQRKQLMAQSQFDDKAEQIILNLASLGVLLQSDKPQTGHKNKEYWKFLQKSAKMKAETVSITRYTSYLEWILNSHRSGDLKDSQFEWVEKPAKSAKAAVKATKQRVATSYRRHKNTDGKNDPKSHKGSMHGGPAKDGAAGNPRIIVYVLGGVSYSEMCVCYKFSKQHNIDVFVGSTSILSPGKYLNLLAAQDEAPAKDANLNAAGADANKSVSYKD